MCRLAPLGLLLVLSVVGCGGAGSSSRAPEALSPVVERSYGTGPDRVWVFTPAGRDPRALVVFFHGLGDQAETTPVNHLPWLRHLAAKGNVVLYPRFEVRPGAPRALKHAIFGIRTGVAQLKLRLPVVAIGYSRGGGLAFDYTAVAPAVGVVPRALLAVFPAMLDPPLDMRAVDPRTRYVFLVGDRDTQVRDFGAKDMISSLASFGYPSTLVRKEIVRSHRGFQATHLSVLDDSPGGRAAFWARADRLIASVLQAEGKKS